MPNDFAFGPRGGGFLNYNQLLSQLAGASASPLQNMAQQTMDAFGQANALSSANLQSRYPTDAAMEIERQRQQGDTHRLGMLLNSPLLQALTGGGNSPLTGMTSNFGQSVSLGGQQQQTPLTATQQRQQSRLAAQSAAINSRRLRNEAIEHQQRSGL